MTGFEAYFLGALAGLFKFNHGSANRNRHPLSRPSGWGTLINTKPVHPMLRKTS